MATEKSAAFLDMDLREEDLAVARSSQTDLFFDQTIGHIEDLIMEDEFQNLQTEFMTKHFQEFEDTDENKFIYTDTHQEYTVLIEKYLTKELQERMPGFSMEEFQKQLVSRKEELEGEVFEILLTFTDFLAFKEMMLDFRAEQEGRSPDLGMGLTVTALGGPGAALSPAPLSLSGVGVGASPTNGGPHCTPKDGGSEEGLRSRLGCGEPMLEGGNTPSSSMDLGDSAGPGQLSATPLLDGVDMTEEAGMESPRLDK